jgi:membrane protease subunit HflK
MSDSEFQDKQNEPLQDEPLQIAAEEPQPEPEPEDTGSKAWSDALRVSFLFLQTVMAAVVVFYLAAGVFWVKPNEVRFKLRFGRLLRAGTGDSRVLRPGSGWHIRWPWEEYVVVPTDEKVLELKKEFWAGTEQDDRVRKVEKLDVRTDGYLISGDANIVHAKLSVRYNARNDDDGAVAFAFAVKEPEEVLRRELMSASAKVVGSMPVMDVIRRKGLVEEIAKELRSRLATFEEESGVPLGVEVIAVEAVERERIKNPTEPGQVQQAFFQAQNAANKRNQLVKEGETEAKRIINDAQATAAELLAEAQGYAVRLVREARVDARQLEQLLPVYESSAEEAAIMLEDFYQQTVVEALINSPGAFVLHQQPDGKGELWVQHTRPPVSNGEE